MEKVIWDFLHFARKLYWRTFKIKTFGVRVILIKDKKFFLVKHRYGNLWCFPGGGIKKGESAFDAGKRELKEEANIEVLEFGNTLGVYKNFQEGKSDTVTVVVVKRWVDHGRRKCLEIKDSGWFGFSEMEGNISKGTKRRIEEFMGKASVKGDW